MPYTLPPTPNNKAGNQRCVGLELEFAGIKIEEAAKIIQSLYGGKIEKEHRYHFQIIDTEFGDFTVELDARILKKMASENIFEKWGIKIDEKTVRKSIEDVVDKLAKTVVPLEVVMPPVQIKKLHRLEELRNELQKNKAEGTGTSLVHAFGMHINIESPDLETPTLLRYLRSVVLLYPWLLKVLKIDFMRRVSPFVDPYPPKYVQKILDPSYNPDQQQFIEDYLEFNATRNRVVDMMPIFGLLNAKLIEPVMEGEKNAPRAAFHYRLPNSRIDDADWRFEDEWNHWLAVEKLAEDEEMLRKLSRLYLLRKEETVISFRKEWVETIKILLDLDE